MRWIMPIVSSLCLLSQIAFAAAFFDDNTPQQPAAPNGVLSPQEFSNRVNQLNQNTNATLKAETKQSLTPSTSKQPAPSLETTQNPLDDLANNPPVEEKTPAQSTQNAGRSTPTVETFPAPPANNQSTGSTWNVQY